jgi:hypothetical protein
MMGPELAGKQYHTESFDAASPDDQIHAMCSMVVAHVRTIAL